MVEKGHVHIKVNRVKLTLMGLRLSKQYSDVKSFVFYHPTIIRI